MLAARFGVTAQTIYKWRKRDSVEDRSHTPHRLQTTLTPAQEAAAVALRKTLLVSLDDLLAVVREFLNPPLQAMKEWHKLKLRLFRKQPYYQPGCDTPGRQALGGVRISAAVGAPAAPDSQTRTRKSRSRNFTEAVAAAIPARARGKSPEVRLRDDARVSQHGTLTRVRVRRGSPFRAPRDTRHHRRCILGAVCPSRGVRLVHHQRARICCGPPVLPVRRGRAVETRHDQCLAHLGRPFESLAA